jgi:hypothetical protein
MLNNYLAAETNVTDPITRHAHYVANSHIQLPFTIGGLFFVTCSIGMAICWFYKVVSFVFRIHSKLLSFVSRNANQNACQSH